MMNRMSLAAGLLPTMLYATGSMAHTGEHAHAHAGHGPIEQVGHWLAGVLEWGGTAPLLLAASGIAVALLIHRHGRHSRSDR